jgi:hypothetical protein
MWTQIVGKVKLELAPFLNQWWDRSVADFYHAFMAALGELGMQVQIRTMPVEVENTIPFDQDQIHASYDPAYVTRWWRIVQQVDRLLQQYRTPFVGKSSPVLFYWGSFDLAETRFSGRPAPERAWPTRWMALAEDQEQASAGFWPGSGRAQEPAFYAYTYPEPPGYREAAIQPDGAYYHLPRPMPTGSVSQRPCLPPTRAPVHIAQVSSQRFIHDTPEPISGV